MPLMPERWEKPFDVCSQKAIIEATMHFPSQADAEKRRRLGCFLDFHRSVDFDLLASDDDETYGARHVILGYEGRYLEELQTSYEDVFSGAFYAAHWLRYRLYASRQFPDLNSSSKWVYYIRNDVAHKLPRHWARGHITFNRARKKFASVAHLWLALFDETGPGLTPFPRVGAPRRPPPPRQRGHFERVFLARAKSYYSLAQELGVYGDGPGKISIGEVWQLPDEIGLVPIPEFDKPDLLVDDFDAEWYLEQYKDWIKKNKPALASA